MQYQLQLLALLPFLAELISAHPVSAVSFYPHSVEGVANEEGQYGYKALKARQNVCPLPSPIIQLQADE
jgi:hypothetical protein